MTQTFLCKRMKEETPRRLQLEHVADLPEWFVRCAC
jgi:hypothetical protein